MMTSFPINPPDTHALAANYWGIPTMEGSFLGNLVPSKVFIYQCIESLRPDKSCQHAIPTIYGTIPQCLFAYRPP